MYNLLKRDPRRRWSAEEALASPWLACFAPSARGSTPPPSSTDSSSEEDLSIRTRLLSSMRDYGSYGTLRRIALMVVAYNQAPEKLVELRREFGEFDTVRCCLIQPFLEHIFVFQLTGNSTLSFHTAISAFRLISGKFLLSISGVSRGKTLRFGRGRSCLVVDIKLYFPKSWYLSRVFNYNFSK